MPANAEIERVLVVPTSLFHELGLFQGFTADTDRYLDTLLAPDHVSYRPRDEVEQDPGYKQLIPYVIFQHRAENGTLRVFQYIRGSGQDEGRLRKKRSVGIGGHISFSDVSANPDADPYQAGLARELAEEVVIDTPYQARCAGLINDDSNPVGRVHLGVVHLFTVERPAVQPRESEILESGFRPARELLADLDGFETWSQIALTALYGG